MGRQRTLFEVIDLAQSDSGSDTIQVRHQPIKKRKRESAADDSNQTAASHGPPRKAARTRAPAKTKPKPAMVDLSHSSDEDVIHVASKKSPSKVSRTSKPASPRKDAVRPEDQIVLRELSPAQFQNKLRGPIAWCKRPAYDSGFLSQFSPATPIARAHTMSTATRQPRSAASTPVTQRSRRTAAKSSYVLADSSEDELAGSVERPAKKSASKKGKKIDSSDEDFMDGSEDSLHYSEESDIDTDDGTSIATGESSAEETVKKTSRPKSPKKSVRSARGETPPDQEDDDASKALRKSTNMKSLMKSGQGLNLSLAPLFKIDDIFADMTTKAYKLGLSEAIEHFGSRPLRVATMCSGTESPLLAFEMIRDALRSEGLGDLHIEHLFSAEIVAFKQAYIERNFKPPIIFRDITELIQVCKDDKVAEATTAYGAKVAVPTDLDIIIAGTSCVDYSGMNSRKKGIHDGGESGDTWHAVLEFCTLARPSIVLLENVRHGPWNQMLVDYQNIGYESAGVFVDTKDFYIPHTRQRGYMVCFDKKKLGENKGAASKWVSLMEKMKRPASSAVSSFLLPNDQVAREQFRNDEPTREYDWSTCQISQMEYRQDMRLGHARPITHWSESGSMQVPDNGNAQWFQRQVERVLDTIDGGHLRKALPSQGMYDNRYKTRVVDLSQNLHREQDKKAFGISGCITPSGMFYITDAGRAFTSEETLILQGLPLDKISLTTETATDIQDLSGNAMSTTVIGSAILSALIAGHRALPESKNAGPIERDITAMSESSDPHFVNHTMTRVKAAAGLDSIDVLDSLRRAETSLRKCYCEGPKGFTDRMIQRCLKCGHTACIACGGNPSHEYVQDALLTGSRMSPRLFEEKIRSILPLRLRLSDDKDSLSDFLSSIGELKNAPPYRLEMYTALLQTFSFRRIRRTYCWTVTYQAPGATLELVIENVGNAEWRLYAHPPQTSAVNSSLRAMLRQPVARSRIRNNFLGDGWEMRVPQAKSASMTVTSSGSEKVASWWARNEMPDFEGHAVWKELIVKTDKAAGPVNFLNGTYRHLPECETASHGLYKKVDSSDEPIFLFLDPTRTGNPDDDCFVFSHNISRLEYDEVRPIIARVAPPWRPWSTDEKKNCIPVETRPRLVVDDIWQPLPKTSTLSAEAVDFDVRIAKEPATLVDSAHCTHSPTLLTCGIDVSEVPITSIARGATIKPSDNGFFEHHAWVFEAMRRHLPSEEWLPLNKTFCHCEDCAPPRPELRWSLSDTGNIVPYEDPETAAAYERSIKSRPDPLIVRTNISPSHLQLDLGINIATLSHRAGARLQKYCGSHISFLWRLTTQVEKGFTFKPFRIGSTADVDPYEGDLGLTVDLFPKQRLALAWMKQQEDGVEFMLEEMEETSIPTLGWRAELKAQGAFQARGGICADHPGFGKTITSLALIQSQIREQGRGGIVSELSARQDLVAPGLIPTAATLIISPHTLQRQWVSEIEEKLEDEHKVLSVSTMADLTKYSLSDFERATIIVVNRNLFANEAYAERLAAFAGVPGPATKSGRSYTHWLRSVTKDIPEHLKILNRGYGLKALQGHLKSAYRDNLESERFQAVVPSRRLRGKDYVAGKDKKKTTIEKAAPSSIDVSMAGKPLFEMFYFNRIILDEFHQFEPKEHAAIQNLKADKRWGLSATPAMDDFYDIAQMASLLGITLRTGSGASGVMKAKNARDLRKETTSFELFDIMRQMPSDSMHARIHEIDQSFLDMFVRRNIMDFADQLVYQEHLVPVRLDHVHMALYSEISQHLNSLDMRIKKTSKSKATDRQQRFHSVIDSSLTAEEALSKSATFPEGERSLENLMAVREKETKAILAQLRQAVSEAKQKEPGPFDSWRQSRLDEGSLGDDETIGDIMSTSGLARKPQTEKASIKKTGSKVADKADGKAEGKKREKTAKLNDMCTRLLMAKRSSRYLHNLQQLELASSYKKGLSGLCGNPTCHSHNVDEAAVSVLCGHVICRDCYTALKEQGVGKCLANGCSSSMQDMHLLWPSMTGNTQTDSVHGAKLDAAVSLLHEIKDRGDQAILFVQFENQLGEVQAALEDSDIDATVVTSVKDAGEQIEDFRNSAGSAEQTTVMVLNASDETAAGSNLQNANHVIFLSPLLRDTQYGYESTMMQAIGRVRRFGQEKEIHVYRIVALNTIDVDIMEHRERRVNALTERDAPKISPPRAANELDQRGEVKPERTQLVREDRNFSLRPQSWLVKCGADEDAEEREKVKGKNRVLGWEDYSSLVKFSKAFTEDDDW